MKAYFLKTIDTKKKVPFFLFFFFLTMKILIPILLFIFILVSCCSIITAAAETVELHPDLVHFDLTRGQGLNHPSLKQVNTFYKEIISADEFFKGARESESIQHILKLADDIIPDLEGGLNEICQPIHAENNKIDTESEVLRNKVNELNELYSASAASSNKILLDDMISSGKELASVQDRFIQVHSVHAMCTQSKTRLEQLSGEVAFAKHAVGEKKKGFEASMDF